QPGRTGYRHCPFRLDISNLGDSLALNVPAEVDFLDEPYWPLIGDRSRVEVLASAKVDGQSFPLIWTFQKWNAPLFSSVLGHYTWTLDDPMWRQICLHGIAWAGRREPTLLDRAIE